MPLYNPPQSVTTTLPTSSTGTPSSLSVGTTITQIPLDLTRKGLALSNKSLVSIYVNASNITPTAATNLVELLPSAYFEFPQPIYTGVIGLAAASGSGNNVSVTVFT
jgi:hypothetical protein